MGRSVSAAGAIAALDLLPKEVSLAEPGVSLQVICTAESRAEPGVRIASATLLGATHSLALSQVLSKAVLPAEKDGATTASADLTAGRLPEALGKLLVQVVEEGCENGGCAYSIALCLAAMLENSAAHTVLTLVEGPMADHPAVTALGGYLLFQLGDTDRGRRALSRAAMAARRVPEYGPVLRFTQHVLLVQQFGG
jgi:hypothetical protein